MKPIYGQHYDFDNDRWYRFARNSGLPIGTFPRAVKAPMSRDAKVFWIVIALGLFAFLI